MRYTKSLLCALALIPTLVFAQETQDKSTFAENEAGAYSIPGAKKSTFPLSETLAAEKVMQPNVELTEHYDHGMDDDASYSKTLFDVFEYGYKGDDSLLRWDVEHWQGGDYKRWWIKSEGEKNAHGSGYDADLQLLKSTLRRPYTEFQYGVRLQTRKDDFATATRPQAVVGFHALMPYEYEMNTHLYVDHHGKISGSLKASKDYLISQKLILQSRTEVNLALQEVEKFGIGKGLNSISNGLRLRYEIRREFAPYIGITHDKMYGKTATFARQSGERNSRWRFVAGVRMWF